MNERLPYLRKKSMSLPLTPGVYLMKNKKGEIIYVGKAKALKNRVSSYFGSQNNHTAKVRKMVENVEDFDYIMCDSEFEALVLECSLIKQHSPKYNILLKDDKGYHYIKITSNGWKNILAVKQRFDDGAEYIGPYTGSYGVTNAVAEAKKIFLLPQCSKVFPRDYNKSRPCLNYFIGQCAAPCAGKTTAEAHAEAVEQAIDFIVNGSGKAVEALTEKMLAASENLEFEKAAKLRDRINAIKKVSEKQKVVAASVEEQDVFAVVCSEEKACLSVIRFRNSRLYDNEDFIIDAPENMPEARHELLRSYYSMRDFVPRRITVDGEIADSEVLCEWLSSLAGRKVTAVCPQRGEQHSLVEMCRSNAAQKLAIYLGKTGRATAALDELATLLGLKSPPKFIESYDISHTAGSENVAGMVVFKDGAPFKKSYRRFAIKGFTGQDDYASMAEVIERRILRYFEEKDSGEGFGRLPDLILLDGGSGQVNAVKPVLEKYGLDIPLFGMVKDSHHRTRAIACSGDELSLTSKRAAFTLVSTIQEEVHRYSVEYHRNRRKKASLSSSLTSINGIGESRCKALLRHFKTVKAVSQASVEELAAVKGMNKIAAQAVFEAFHGQNNA
ncbi:MAG: excinuclease ABC subunit UvrC [Oscillospiraceae bacterium]|nr:excinuclease ABC subunit UvrC [Clostridiaceae bacterium]MDY5948572.1 excinuclease ABC subunit UvrC [Oscillospiraceae bacterium]